LAAKAVSYAAARTVATSGVVDATFCHGSAGLAHILNRLNQPDASRAWVEHTLRLRKKGVGLGGYAHVSQDSANNEVLAAETGLLTGIAGIALVILAAASQQEPTWDAILLPRAKNPVQAGLRHAFGGEG
jgi:hypothetical protein